jgi:hypothetical protein
MNERERDRQFWAVAARVAGRSLVGTVVLIAFLALLYTAGGDPAAPSSPVSTAMGVLGACAVALGWLWVEARSRR